MQRVGKSFQLLRVRNSCFRSSIRLNSNPTSNGTENTTFRVTEIEKHIANDNDHRVLGKKQELFMSHPYSAGSPFFLPHGVKIYSRLQQYLSKQYRKRGYQEVISPNIFLKELWETSGYVF